MGGLELQRSGHSRGGYPHQRATWETGGPEPRRGGYGEWHYLQQGTTQPMGGMDRGRHAAAAAKGTVFSSEQPVRRRRSRTPLGELQTPHNRGRHRRGHAHAQEGACTSP